MNTPDRTRSKCEVESHGGTITGNATKYNFGIMVSYIIDIGPVKFDHSLVSLDNIMSFAHIFHYDHIS